MATGESSGASKIVSPNASINGRSPAVNRSANTSASAFAGHSGADKDCARRVRGRDACDQIWDIRHWNELGLSRRATRPKTNRLDPRPSVPCRKTQTNERLILSIERGPRLLTRISRKTGRQNQTPHKANSPIINHDPSIFDPSSPNSHFLLNNKIDRKTSPKSSDLTLYYQNRSKIPEIPSSASNSETPTDSLRSSHKNAPLTISPPTKSPIFDQLI